MPFLLPAAGTAAATATTATAAAGTAATAATAAGATAAAGAGAAAAGATAATAASSFTTTLAVMSAIGTGVTALGQYQQGRSAEAMAEYNAQVQEQKMESVQAAQEMEVHQLEKEKRKRLGTIRARSGAFGGTMGGSPLEFVNEALTEFEIEKATTRYNYGVERTRAQSQARLSRFGGRETRRLQTTRSAGTILSGTSNFMRRMN